MAYPDEQLKRPDPDAPPGQNDPRAHSRPSSRSRGSRLTGILVAVILILGGASLLVLGAIPVATPLIGLPVAVYAFGILARDGAVVAAGHVLVLLVAAGLVYLRTQTGG